MHLLTLLLVMLFALVIAYYLLCERRQIGRHLLLMLPV